MSQPVSAVDPFDLVVFGATGDLSRRKLIPALFRRYVVGEMPAQARVIGVARRDMDTTGFRAMARESVHQFVGNDVAGSQLDAFLGMIDVGHPNTDALSGRHVGTRMLSVGPTKGGMIHKV